MSGYSRAELLDIVARQGRTIDELAASLAVSERAVRSMREALQKIDTLGYAPSIVRACLAEFPK